MVSLIFRIKLRAVDIDIQTVLLTLKKPCNIVILYWLRTWLRSIENPLPWWGRLREGKPQVPNRRAGIRDLGE
jgi:hypothetical protein